MFIGYSDEGPYMRDLLAHVLSEANVRPRIVQVVAQAQAILSLVSAGLGVALIPEGVRSAGFSNVEVRSITVPRGEMVELHAAWMAENENPALEPVRTLMQRLGQHGHRDLFRQTEASS